MELQPGFLKEGFEAAREALIDAMGRAGLHLRPETITKSAARRVRAQLKFIETVLRRLLLLLAAGLDLAPVRPRAPLPANSPTGRPAAPRERSRGFALLPAYGYDPARLDALRDRPRPRHRGRTPTTPLLHRLDTVRRLLENPFPAARRMARILARLKRDRAPKPLVRRQDGLSRIEPRLALTAGILPDKVNTALNGWFDTS